MRLIERVKQFQRQSQTLASLSCAGDEAGRGRGQRNFPLVIFAKDYRSARTHNIESFDRERR